MADNTNNGYDRTKTVQQNVDADVGRIKETYQKDGAQAALEKLQAESKPDGLKGATEEQQTEYRRLMADKLKEAGVLPEIALAYGNQRTDLQKDGKVDAAKLGSALIDADANPKDKLTSTLLSSFSDRYQELKNQPENRYRGVTPEAMDKAIKAGRDKFVEEQNLKPVREDHKKNFGDLLNPDDKLFNKISGGKDYIRKSEVEDFQRKLTAVGPEGDKFRAELGDAAAVKKAKDTADALLKTFNEGKPKPNENGSVMKNDGHMWSNDYITKESLAKGMGYKDVADAQAKLPKEKADNPRPVTGVEPVANYDDTRLAAGKGPQDLAARMLNPEQAKKAFGDDAAAAQRSREDLAYVMRKGGPFFKDQGKPEITAENRDAVLAALREREKARAKPGETVDTRGSDWFASRYPKIEGTPPPAGPDLSQVKPDTNREKGRIAKEDGPIKIAERMTAGEPLDAAAKLALQKAIKPGEYDDKVGPLTDKSIEAIRKNVNAGNNDALKQWFAKRYPPKA